MQRTYADAHICTDFLSLVATPLFFALCSLQNFGWWAFRFFSAAEKAIGFYLVPPLVRITPPTGNLVSDTCTAHMMTAAKTEWKAMMAVTHCNASGDGLEQRFVLRIDWPHPYS